MQKRIQIRKETPYEAEQRRAMVHAIVMHFEPSKRQFGLSLGEKVKLAYQRKAGS